VPEGHTIHRLALDHAGQFAGQKVRVTSPQGRFAAAAAQLDGRRFLTADAWGKHLFHRYDAG
jgi:formamidopyrimidine-DNA glycosylase